MLCVKDVAEINKVSLLSQLIGQQFIIAIESKLVTHDMWNKDVQSAWQHLFKFINYNIQRGMADELADKRSRGK